ncbi:MAG: hydantoinase B/oxoprolinase family protein [Chloroflexi bacterium]|nr:hydantoinase B/oxoprolinase family protein [Chloroflexota bacterium]
MAYAAGEQKVDPVTFEVVRHRLVSIVTEQAITLKAVSGSPIVTEASDFNTGLYWADGTNVIMGQHVLLHAGNVALIIENIIKECEQDPGIGEDDMFIVNDPYSGGLHVSDITISAPVFYDGQRVAWAGCCAHQLDVGGMDPGSWCPRATERQQEGLTIPPVRLVEKGRLRNDILNVILSMSRLPITVALDLRAMIAANNVAKRRLTAVFDRYGLDTVLSVMNGVVELSERRLRERLRELPDGIYRSVDFLDHDGQANKLYKFAVTLTKEADKLTFDLTGTSAQAPTCINCSEGGLYGGIGAALLEILAPDLPWNGGLLKPIEIVAPKGIVCNALPPAPTSAGSCAACWVAQNAAVVALSRLVGCSDRYRREAQGVSNAGLTILNLGGNNQYGEPFGTLLIENAAAGGSACSFKDGLDVGGPLINGVSVINNVETNENSLPILYLRRSLVADSSGPGEYRGGRTLSVGFIPHDVPSIEGVLVGHGVEVPAVGIFGGFPGSSNVSTICRRTGVRERFRNGELPTNIGELRGESETLEAKAGRVPIAAADVFQCDYQGGGGYGDPLERDPTSVALDVADGVISVDLAERIYGVILNPQSLRANFPATEQFRKDLRWQRLGSVPRPALVAGNKIMQIGSYLEVVVAGDVKVFRCRCGHGLGPITENWKKYAVRKVVPATTAGPSVKLHEDLEMREYLCPGCGLLHSVEISRRDDPPLWEIELKI